MNVYKLKKEIESLLLITDWSPSNSQLTKIAKQISKLNVRSSKNDLARIVFDVYGPFESIVLEGIDNSDLTTLLLMATKVSKEND